MKKLIDGVRQFQEGAFRAKQSLFERLAGGQRPLALFITCSDSRIDPNLLTNTEPGELFVLRNCGNIVPPYGSVRGGEAATIEFAVKFLKVADVIVCGHSHCGAMAARLAPDRLKESPAVRDWLIHTEGSRPNTSEECGHISEASDPLAIAVEENVLVQLEQLRSHPSVADAPEQDEIRLHGWVYQFETGEVFAYDSEQGQFHSINAAVSHA